MRTLSLSICTLNQTFCPKSTNVYREYNIDCSSSVIIALLPVGLDISLSYFFIHMPIFTNMGYKIRLSSFNIQIK